MRNIEIKPITKEFNNVRINIEVLDNKAIATCHIIGLSESLHTIIEGAEYEAWGNDDNYIYDLILSKLGLEKSNS